MKILSVFMAICMLLSFSAVAFAEEADITIEVTDVQQNKISVSGAAPKDTFVTVMVLNPGFSADDIDFDGQTSDKEAIQYFGFAKSQGGSFKKEIIINTASGGDFTVCTVAGGRKITKTFQFYCYEAKNAYVEMLKGAPTEEQLPEIISTYSLSSHPLYNVEELSAIAALIPKMNKGRKLQTPTDAAEFLLEVLLVNAYNNDNENAFKDDKMAYADVLKIENEPWYTEYTSSISDEGYKAIKSGFFADTYTSLSEIKESLKSQMHYHAIMNNKNYGGDHVEYFMETYGEEYKQLGFDIAAYKNSDKKKAVFLELIASGASNITALKNNFNSLFAEKEESLPPASVPSGGGGGGGGAKPTPTPSPTPSATPTPTPETELPFEDIKNVPWAHEAIKTLYEKEIINGRSESEFAPSQNVTRAEFVKLVVEALSISGNSGESFADVSEGDWFKPFVERAVSAEIIKGDRGNFMPNGNITREDAAVIIARSLGLDQRGTPTFRDSKSVSPYALGAVNALSEKGIINGVGDNMYAPKETLTRAQAAVLIYNVLGGANK